MDNEPSTITAPNTTAAASAPASVKPPAYHGHARSEMLAFVPADARRVLEAGCGEGLFGALL